MTSRRPALVRKATRRALRGLATEMYVKAIEGLWQDQGFVPVSELYYEDSNRPSSFDEIRELLDDDGFELDEQCRIHWRRPPALEATLAGLTDPSGIRAELERIRRALPDDPAGTIGAAKQLVEATAKVVLTERHLPVTGDAKVPELVKAAQQALHLHPSSTIPGPDSSEAVKRSSAACRQSRSEWRNSAIAAMAPATARPAHRQGSARGMRIWLSMLQSPGATCSSTPSLIPRRHGAPED
jgi:hypothetical protein